MRPCLKAINTPARESKSKNPLEKGFSKKINFIRDNRNNPIAD
jgi:hypothetical protein